MTKKKKTMGRGRGAAVIVLFALAAVLSAVFMGKVAINYNLADYLGKDTQTKIALDLIEDEFGMTGSLQVMVKDVSADTADEICGELEDIPDVLNVSFDKYDERKLLQGRQCAVRRIDRRRRLFRKRKSGGGGCPGFAVLL